MKSVKVTCYVLLAGLTCLGIALVGAAPGQPAPPRPGAGPADVPNPPGYPATGVVPNPPGYGGAGRVDVVPSDAARALGQVLGTPGGSSFQGAAGGSTGYVQYGNHLTFAPGAAGPVWPNADPELIKLIAEARKAEAEQAQLLAKYAKTTDPAEREKIKGELSKVLERQFDLQQKQREREVAQIEARVKKLREMIDNRNKAKQTIVVARRDQLLNEADGMGWVSPTAAGPLPSTSGRFGSSNPNFGGGGSERIRPPVSPSVPPARMPAPKY